MLTVQEIDLLYDHIAYMQYKATFISELFPVFCCVIGTL